MSIPKGSLNCFFDESDLREIDLKTGMILVGGFFIPKADMMKLDKEIVKVKSNYKLDETNPIKWSMDEKDYAESMKKINEAGGIEKLRIDMISIVNKLENIRLLMATCYRYRPQLRESAWKTSFDWVMQRLSMILDRKKNELKERFTYPFLDVIFDWPPSSGKVKINEFFEVYQRAYIKGYPDLKGNPPPLRDLKACPCLVFCDSDFSLALQLADCLVGAIRKFLLWCFSENPDNYKQDVVNYFPIIFNSFYKDPKRKKEVVGYGLTAPDGSLRNKIRNKLKELNLK